MQLMPPCLYWKQRRENFMKEVGSTLSSLSHRAVRHSSLKLLTLWAVPSMSVTPITWWESLIPSHKHWADSLTLIPVVWTSRVLQTDTRPILLWGLLLQATAPWTHNTVHSDVLFNIVEHYMKILLYYRGNWKNRLDDYYYYFNIILNLEFSNCKYLLACMLLFWTTTLK